MADLFEENKTTVTELEQNELEQTGKAKQNKEEELDSEPFVNVIEGTAVVVDEGEGDRIIDDFEKSHSGNVSIFKRSLGFELKKHVGAIHTSSRMTLVQHKLNDFLLLNAFDNLLLQEVHALPLKEVREHLASESNNTEFIKDSLEALKNYPIKWNILDEKGEEDWVTSSVIAEARIKNGTVYYAYGPFLRERLASPEVYALLDLRIQQSFTTEHALKLWENCYRFKNVGSTGIIGLDKWKQILLAGDPVQSYPEFKDFKRYVLAPAIEQVNTISNIEIIPHYHKEPGTRKIVAIRFDVNPNNQSSMNFPGKFQVDEEIIGILMNEFMITKEKAQKVSTGYPKEYIMEKVEYARVQKKNKNLRSLGGYLIRALEMDFKVVNRKKTATPKPSVEKKAEDKESSSLNKKLLKFKEEKVKQYLASLDEGARKEFDKAFEATLEPKYKETYRTKDLDDSKLMMSFVVTYVINNHIGQDAIILEFAKQSGLS